MTAPLIFIVLPSILTVVLFILQRYPRINQVLGTSAACILLLLSLRLPIMSPIFLGIPRIPALIVGDSLFILGRRFFIDHSLLPVLALIYLVLILWFSASFITHVKPLFIPLCFGIGVLLVASIAVDPPLYSALFIVLAALFSVPLFSPPGVQISASALRLLIFQVLGMGLFLFADWYISSIQEDQEIISQVPLAVALMGLGIAFMAGIFPFHTWIPMIASSSAPLPATFVIFTLPFAASYSALRYLNFLNPFIPQLDIQQALLLVGILMVMAGGIWAVFEHHLGRLLAFAMLIQIGNWLLSFTLLNQSSPAPTISRLFFYMLLPQSLALVLGAVALEVYGSHLAGAPADNLLINRSAGMARQSPFLSTGLLVAVFSLAGLPVLANFPFLLILSSQIARTSTLFAGIFWFGHLGLLAAGLRLLAVLTKQTSEGGWKISEKKYQAGYLVIVILALIMLKFLPGWSWLAPAGSNPTTSFLLPW